MEASIGRKGRPKGGEEGVIAVLPALACRAPQEPAEDKVAIYTNTYSTVALMVDIGALRRTLPAWSRPERFNSGELKMALVDLEAFLCQAADFGFRMPEHGLPPIPLPAAHKSKLWLAQGAPGPSGLPRPRAVISVVARIPDPEWGGRFEPSERGRGLRAVRQALGSQLRACAPGGAGLWEWAAPLEWNVAFSRQELGLAGDPVREDWAQVMGAEIERLELSRGLARLKAVKSAPSLGPRSL